MSNNTQHIDITRAFVGTGKAQLFSAETLARSLDDMMKIQWPSFGDDHDTQRHLKARKAIAHKIHRVNFDVKHHFRADADHWKHLAQLISDVRKDVTFDDTSPNYAFIFHMLETFGRGERFIVAKLAYQQ